jgi:hypothetical protein
MHWHSPTIGHCSTIYRFQLEESLYFEDEDLLERAERTEIRAEEHLAGAGRVAMRGRPAVETAREGLRRDA